MAGATLSTFPASTSVSCYPLAQCDPYKAQAQAPPLTATATATADSTTGVTTFSGITAGLYYAVGTVGGNVRYVAFEAS